MRHPRGETVTVTRPGATTGAFDEGGNPVLDADATFDIEHVAVAPAGTEEDPQALGLWVTTGYTLYLPFGTVLKPADRLAIRGISGWQVVGDTEAAGWRNPFSGLTPGVVVSVKRAG